MAVFESKFYTLGIVGGGKIGLDFIRLFSESKFSKVSYVVDRDKNAPAIPEAKKPI
jgi:hypothetical protein